MRKENNKRKGFLKKSVTGVIAGALALTLAVGVMQPGLETHAAKVADLNTTTKYTESLGNNASTEYAGRIWTDKSVWDTDASVEGYPLEEGQVNTITVENDSDFLVALSALATSQSITGQSQAPVDVVFIIDLSGSMSNSSSNMDNGRSRIYNTVQELNHAIEKLMELNPHNRIAVVGFSDTAKVLLQLDHYTKRNNNAYFRVSRQTGSNSYCDLTVNAVGATTGTVSNAETEVSGGTNLQSGYYMGMNLLASAESTTVTVDGKTVTRIPSVILLGDGSPTFSSSDSEWWSPANNDANGSGSSSSARYGNGFKAMMTAAWMKAAIDTHYGVTGTNSATKLYTIGMGLDDISYTNAKYIARTTLNPAQHWDASNDQARAMREAWSTYASGKDVSVNVEGNSTYRVTHPTEKTQDEAFIKNYPISSYVDSYYDADDASSVTNVFNDIVSSISISAPEVPTEHDEENPLTSGYITFTDPIGEYMEVKALKSIVYAGHTYEQVTATTNGNKTTYVFAGTAEGNDVYKEQPLENIIIEVVSEETGIEGIVEQTLTVKIPAALIPIRVNTVTLNSDGAVKTHTNNGAYPIRVFYTVGLQEAVKSGDIISLEKISEEYLSENTNEDGTVNFYSNLYTGEESPYDENVTIGNTTAVFDAAPTNPFYYMQEDMPVYTNEACTIKASNIENNANTFYYYKETYYYGNEIRTAIVVRSGAQLLHNTALTKKADGYYYRPAGTVRVNRMLEFEGDKNENNNTNTATDFYTPTYNSNTGHFTVYLGNNGLLKMKATGSLEITKKVTADTNLTAPEKHFIFTVNLTDAEGNALTGTYNYTVTEGDTSVRTGTIANGGTLTLEDGQTAKIVNLPPDAEYTVVETAVAGFTTSVNGTDGNRAEGTITAGETASEVFTNYYDVETLSFPAENGIHGKKVLVGRTWDSDVDNYTFTISAYNNAPLPETTKVTVTTAKNNEAVFDFGSIEFTEPGVYRYTIYENEPENDAYVEGISYSRALYRVVITVVDNGNGTLSATSDIQKLYTDDATALFTYDSNNNIVLNKGEEAQDEVVFTNTYSAESVTRVPVALKSYTDHSGKNPLVSGMFHFKLTPLGVVKDGKVEVNSAGLNPMPIDAGGNKLTSVTTDNEGHNITFPGVTFTHADLHGQDSITFRYQMEEVIPEGANTDNDYTVNGMTYDPNDYVIDVTVSINAESDILNVNAVYPNGQRVVTFVNSYEEEPISLDEEGVAPIKGSKVFTGREDDKWLDTVEVKDTFTFKLTPVKTDQTGVIVDEKNLSTKDAVDKGVVVIADDEITVAASDAQAGNAVFKFDDITFKKQGVFKFEVHEVPGELGGVTYDTKVYTVTVTVTDSNKDGKLEADVTYSTGAEAAFENTYKAQFNPETAISLGGTKQMRGRELTAGAFFFNVTLEESNQARELVPVAADGSIKLLDSETYTEAGVYTYIIKEQYPLSEEEMKELDYVVDGVTYDRSIYRVVVTVTDNNKGDLSAEITSVEKSLDGGDTYITYEEALVFVNEYNTTNAEVELYDITKILEGTRKEGETEKPLQAEEFTFELSIVRPNTDDDLTKEDGVIVEKTVAKNDANGNVDFGKIKFTKPGTYVLRATEQIPADATDNGDGTYTKDGITYSTNYIQSAFLVTDNGEGALIATRTGTIGSREFKNKYETKGTLIGETDLEVTKNFVGREWKEDESYTFLLVGHDAVTRTAIESGKIVLPEIDASKVEVELVEEEIETDIKNVSAIVITYDMTEEPVDEGSSMSTVGRNSFGNIVFKEAGTYKFHIREIAGNENGVDYDGVSRVITVSAVDDGEGTLTVSISSIEGGSNNLVFTNVYEPGDVILYGHGNLHVNKILTGREWKTGDQFTFTIEPDTNHKPTKVAIAGENPDIVMQAPLEITIDSGNKDYIHFGNITFKKEGIYQFIVKEEIPDDADDNEDGTHTKDGITYSEAGKTIVVSAVDNEDGTMSVSIVSSQDNLIFENVYNPEPAPLVGETNLRVKKVFTGRPDNEWLDTEEVKDIFTFKLTPVNDDKTGIIEKSTDSETGTEIEINLSTAAAVESEKDYVTMSDSREIKISKADLNDGIYSKAFGNIIFTEVGTYTFEITETAGNIAGVTYDRHVETVVINVTDNGEGELVAAITSTDKDYTFNNTYKADATTATIQGIKTITGREFLDTDAFEFLIRVHSDSPAGTPLPANTRVHVTGAANAYSWDVVFGEITYTAPGNYHYVVSEASTNIAGVTKDPAEWDVYVTVTDNNDGTMSAAVSYSKNGEEDLEGFKFENIYEPAPSVLSGRTNLKVNKTISGREWFRSDEFTFTIEAKEDYGTKVTMPNPSTVTMTAATAGNTAFGDIIFHEAGDYIFYVNEDKGTDTTISYDNTAKTVVVHVTDDGSGKLKVVVDSASDALSFTNAYDPGSTTATIRGTKTLNGRELKVDEFSFTLTRDASNPADDPIKEEITVKNAADGSVTFGPYTYDTDGKNATYKYTVTEAAENASGVTYDETIWNVTVEIIYNPGTGAYETSVVTYSKADESNSTGFAFENDYVPTASDSVDITATKTVNANAGSTYTLEGGEFSFTITPSETNPENDPIGSATVTNDANGYVEFVEGVTFESEGTYVYTVEEVAGDAEGINYDGTVYTITVSITDDKAGKLQKEVTILKDGIPTDAIAFSNEYTPGAVTLEGKTHLKVNKTFTGREGDEWLSTDEFTFTLAPDTETADAVGTTVFLPENLTLKVNKGNMNTAHFGNITFTEVGTYVFHITETSDADNNGITYDSHTMTVTINVTDNQSGKLIAATPIITDGGFTNTYKVEPITATLIGKKTLNGRTLNPGEFRFKVESMNDAPLPAGEGATTVTNGENGIVQFAPITFNAPGVYQYKIKEDLTLHVPGIIDYDEGTVIATVTVEDNDNGTMSATVSYSKNGGAAADTFEFVNVYDAEDVTISLGGSKSVDAGNYTYEVTGGMFDFTITPSADNPASDPVKAEGYTRTVSNDANKNFTFADLTFSEEGTYVYDITEKIGSITGIEYDPTVYTVKVIVEDNEDAKLTAKVFVKTDKKDGSTNAVSDFQEVNDLNTMGMMFRFTNDYKPRETSVVISGKKILTGKELVGGEFTFCIAPHESNQNAPMPQNNTTTNDASGVFRFDEIIYNDAGDIGTWKYVITEIVPENAADRVSGVSYSPESYMVTVVITDTCQEGCTFDVNHEGNCSTSAAVSSLKLCIENCILEEGHAGECVVEDAKECLEGCTLEAGHEGECVVEEAKECLEGCALEAGHEGECVVEEARECLEGCILEAGHEGECILEKPSGAGNTEQASMLKKMWNVLPIKFTLTGTSNFEKVPTGILRAQVTIESGEIVFTNVYTPNPVTLPGATLLNGKKTVGPEGNPFVIKAGDFEFEIVPGDNQEGDPLDASGFDATATNDANGEFAFGNIEFKQTGTYWYTILEKNSSIPGITNTTVTYTVKVEVTDEGKDGQLDCVVTYYKSDNPNALFTYNSTEFNSENSVIEFEFTNTYQAAPTNVQLAAAKDLIGRKLKAGEFEFIISAHEETPNAPLPENTTAFNDENSVVTFGEIEYTKAGTYSYIVSENKGSLGGITYDQAKYKITVTVTDDGSGYLKATVETFDVTTGDKADVVFTNTYQAAPTNVTLTATKKLNGRKLKANEFTFELVDELGKVVDTATNDADGKVTFDTITYKEVPAGGKVSYTIREVADKKLSHVKYDTTVYNVIVTITDDGEGQLKATVKTTNAATGNAADVVFTNTYKKSSKPDEPKDEPKDEPVEVYPVPQQPTQGGGSATGDSSNIIGLLALAFAAVFGLGGVTLYKRKKH